MRLHARLSAFAVLSLTAVAAGAVESKEVVRRSIQLGAGVRTVAVDNVFGSVAVERSSNPVLRTMRLALLGVK